MTNQTTLPTRMRNAIALVACAGLLAAATVVRAQTPAPTPGLDTILKELATYNGGIESAAAWKLRDYVIAHRNDPAGRLECETKLLQFMKSVATVPAKTEASRHLRAIAGDTAIPALQAMLADDRLSDLALYVLKQIPGPAAGKAMTQAVASSTGSTKIAVIGALGDRRERDAVPALTPLLLQSVLAMPAAIALGRIGGDAATAALTAAGAGAPAALKSAIASALLQCAEGQIASKNLPAALKIYDPLAADTTLAAPIRRAAAMGRIGASGAFWPNVLFPMLMGSDPVLQTAAVAKLRSIMVDNVSGVCEAFPKLGETTQVQVLAALAGFPSEPVHRTVVDAAKSDSQAVRLAALSALEAVGGAADVPMLAERATRTKGPEQLAARATLAALKGRSVDDAVLAGLSDPMLVAIQGELLMAAGDRRIFPARSAIVKALASPDASLRILALRALRGVGTPSDSTPVMDVLLGSGEGTERTEAEKTLVALASKQASLDGRSRFVRDRLAATKDAAARTELIAVLPMIGDNAALPVLRAALGDPDASVYDAVVRALVAWPSVSAREDVLQLARDSRNETHRLLAIAGLVRLVGLDTTRDPQAAVADLRMAASFAWRPEEQKLVLGALPKFPCREALDLASGFLREPSVSAEAKAAVDRITPRLPKESEKK